MSTQAFSMPVPLRYPSDFAQSQHPALDERQLNPVRYSAEGFGPLEAFVPAGKDVASADPNAPAIVLVPGLGMDGQSWLRQLPLHSLCDFHAVRPPAQPSPGETGLGHFASHYETYIQAAGLDRRPGGVILAGSSMGGAISLLMTLRGRVKIRGLVLAGTYGCCKHLNRLQRFAWPLAWALPELVVRRVAKPMLSGSDTFGRFTPQEIEFMLRCITIPSRGYFGRAASALAKLDLISRAHEVKTPTLVLHGTEDRVLPLEAGRELARTIPRARLALFENSGHAFFFTHHEAFNTAVASFVVEISGARAASKTDLLSVPAARSMSA